MAKTRKEWRQYYKDYYRKKNPIIKHVLDGKASEREENSRLKYRYGITLDQYNFLKEKQNNKCAICNKEESVKNKKGMSCSLCVDHCHKTNKVRGLLCRKCNSAIGKLNDDPRILFSAYLYLKANIL